MSEHQRQYIAYADVKARLWGQPAITNLIVDQRIIEREREMRRRKEAERIAEMQQRVIEARKAKDRDIRKRRVANVLAVLSDREAVKEAFEAIHIPIPRIFHDTLPSMATIASAVLDKYRDVTMEDLRSSSRARQLVMARRELVVRIRQIRPDISYPQIGRFICKDHTSCIHAVQKWEEQYGVASG